jgi:16S rRNA (cytosine967-C5)-methyltransferase
VDWLKDEVLPFEEGRFDRLLLDAPCSNTGVMRRRVDVRWRLTEAEFERMIDLQRALLHRCLPLLKPGGRLIYSTCSIDREENEAQVAWVLETFSGLQCLTTESRLPQRDNVDGAFAAVLEKI